ncbi:MAG TPA: hypothetical protein VMS22_11440 [Candidatus Eisenbacteria bacterium]|nr:hypothetical protein [Candidatus Eisenbacteria bacterium]
MTVTEERLHQLFVLNLALQLFDGVASWQGIHLFGEGNPFLHGIMAYLGVGMTLLLFKVKACGFLIVLRRCGQHREACQALALVATFYAGLSFVPWMTRIVSLLSA